MMKLSMKKSILLGAVLVMAFTMATVVSHGAVVSSSDSKYTYGDLKADVAQLTATYPDILQSEVLGKTADNRSLYCLYLGNRNAAKQIFVTADMHAREYINGQVVMKSVEYYCANYNTGSYRGVSYADLFNNVCVVIMPMVNPDGVAIATTGSSTVIRNKTLRAKVQKMYRCGGYRNWQDNALGVDLNRNYKVWSKGAKKPQYAYYGGKKAKDQLESQAILTAMSGCTDIKAFINMHSMGNVTYWGYYSKKYKSACWSFVKMIHSFNGYRPINESASKNDHGDFEHYIIKTTHKPYVCIETGNKIPVPHSQFNSIYSKYKNVIAASAYKYK